eukprot:gene9112-1202_t
MNVDNEPIKKYSVHITLWGEETQREKWSGLIMKRREETLTMNLSDQQLEHLKSLGEEFNNLGNYDGDYKLIKNGSEEYDTVIAHMNEDDQRYFNNLASLIEYISLDEFVRIKVKKYNLLKSNLKASHLSETINNKAIEYEGKLLKELVKSNQLPKKFKNDACVIEEVLKGIKIESAFKMNDDQILLEVNPGKRNLYAIKYDIELPYPLSISYNKILVVDLPLTKEQLKIAFDNFADFWKENYPESDQSDTMNSDSEDDFDDFDEHNILTINNLAQLVDKSQILFKLNWNPKDSKDVVILKLSDESYGENCVPDQHV